MTKYYDWSKLKAFADDRIKVNKNLKYGLGRMENIVGNGEKCWLPAFSPFPTIFSISLLPRVVKSLDCLVKSQCFVIHDVYGSLKKDDSKLTGNKNLLTTTSFHHPLSF